MEKYVFILGQYNGIFGKYGIIFGKYFGIVGNTWVFWANNAVFGKLDGVGPVDNRPSTDKPHHFVKKNKNKEHVTCDT